MSTKGRTTFRQKNDTGEDWLRIGPNVGGVNLHSKYRGPGAQGWEQIVFWFAPAKTRQIAAAMLRAADVAEEKT